MLRTHLIKEGYHLKKLKSLCFLGIIFCFVLNIFGEKTAIALKNNEILIETIDVSLDRPFWVLFEITVPIDQTILWPNEYQRKKWLDWFHPDWLVEGQTLLPIPEKLIIAGKQQYGFVKSFKVLKEFIPLKKEAPNESKDLFFLKMKAFLEECEFECRSKTLSAEVEFSLGDGYANISFKPYFSHARANIALSSPWPIRAKVTPSKFQLDVYPHIDEIDEIQTISFLPKEQGLIQTEFTKSSRFGASHVEILTPREWKSEYFNTIEGMLSVSWKDERPESHYWIITPNTIPELMVFGDEALSENINLNLGLAVLFAFLGGIILNLMPCVFPILTIKLFGIVKAGAISPMRVRIDGIAYTVGILISFLVLTAVLLFFKSVGDQVGWGFQLQSPYFILGLIYLFFLVGLNFSGIWEMPSTFLGIGQKLTEKKGVSAPFFTGVLATIVSTPCTAPFMAPAIGYALTLSQIESLVIFLSLGLGLSFPYLLISFIPRIHKLLPKPGPWMVVLRKFLAIPIYLTMGWLLWVYAQQVSLSGVFIALCALIFIFLFALFSKKEQAFETSLISSNVRWVIIVSLLLSISYFSLKHPASDTVRTEGVQYTEGYELVQFSRLNLDKLRAEGRPVFINFTAAWCITCLVHERLVFNQPAVKSFFKNNNIVFMVADWTNPNPEILSILAEYERSGIPFYLFYSKGIWSAVRILPEILTPQKLIGLLDSET